MISLLSFNALLHAVLVVKQKTDGRNNAERESPKTLLFRVLYATLNYKIFSALGKAQQQRVSLHLLEESVEDVYALRRGKRKGKGEVFLWGGAFSMSWFLL